jgi:hypothetical protein
LTGNQIGNCSSSEGGGGVAIKGFFEVSIDGCMFSNCSSNTYGGALLYDCASPGPCSLNIGRDSSFIDNQAKIGGAAIRIIHNTFSTDLSINYLRSDQPNTFYGKPFHLLIFSNETSASYIQHHIDRKDIPALEKLQKRQYNFTTAETLNISVVLLDNFNNVYKAPISARVTVKPADLALELISFENNRAKYESDRFFFDQLRIIAPPGYRFALTIMYDDEIYGLSTIIEITIRPCRPGYVLQNYRCIKCPAGYYTVDLVTTNSHDHSCQICPETAECLGGNAIQPKEDYWRKDSNTDFIVACPIKGYVINLAKRSSLSVSLLR